MAVLVVSTALSSALMMAVSPGENNRQQRGSAGLCRLISLTQTMGGSQATQVCCTRQTAETPGVTIGSRKAAKVITRSRIYTQCESLSPIKRMVCCCLTQGLSRKAQTVARRGAALPTFAAYRLTSVTPNVRGNSTI